MNESKDNFKNNSISKLEQHLLDSEKEFNTLFQRINEKRKELNNQNNKNNNILINNDKH